MIGLIQRVTSAVIYLENQKKDEIEKGLLVFVGIETNDSEKKAEKLVKKIFNYRVFPDENDQMNLNLKEISGGLMLIPQFTLLADNQKGNRPSFSNIAPVDKSTYLFEYLSSLAKKEYSLVKSGYFGKNMNIKLTNNGPATFWLQV